MLVDGDYADRVAFNLICNFERMLERRVPQADLAKWIDCMALDGGLRPGDNSVEVVFVHKSRKLENFTPGSYADDIHGKAFRDQLGEFAMTAYQVEDVVSTEDFFVQCLEVVLSAKETRRVIAVPDMESYGQRVRQTLRHADPDKHVTLLTMAPAEGGNFRQDLLGYSLMAALGIKGEEIERKG